MLTEAKKGNNKTLGKTSSRIELNGKVYDLKAGHVAAAVARPAITAKPKAAIAVSAGKVMDGFTRRPHTKAHAPAPAAPKKTQRSKTLMRSAVTKPANPQATPSTSAVVKPTVINPHRAARASKVSKSHLISRFGSVHDRSFAPQIAPLPVQPAPASEIDTPLFAHHQPISATAPHHGHGHSQPFERALARAESHKQQRPRKKPLSHRAAHKLHVSPRIAKASATLVSILLIGSFFLYQNMPNLAMKVAATRAGINARLPNYHPSGFSMNGQIQYSPGQILVSYRSHSDDRQFNLTQKATDLTPEELLAEKMAANSKSYQTYQDKGKTIYIDDSNNATWVDKGIQYQIESNASLSSDQLLRIATSL